MPGLTSDASNGKGPNLCGGIQRFGTAGRHTASSGAQRDIPIAEPPPPHCRRSDTTLARPRSCCYPLPAPPLGPGPSMAPPLSSSSCPPLLEPLHTTGKAYVLTPQSPSCPPLSQLFTLKSGYIMRKSSSTHGQKRTASNMPLRRTVFTAGSATCSAAQAAKVPCGTAPLRDRVTASPRHT